LVEAKSLPVSSPADGTVVRWLADADRSVEQGTTLAQLALPDEIFVEALIPDGREAEVHVGDRAEIEVITGNKRLGGTIRQVLSPGQSLAEGNFVHPTGVLRDRRHRAIIALDPGSSHAIGQGARVVVIGREPGAIRRLFLRLYTAMML
jgi:hypothetical protein